MSLQNRPLCYLKFYDYSIFLKMYEMEKNIRYWVNTNGLGVKIEIERFTEMKYLLL